jgi:ubiquinone/menaquinone biosynthesis C-methylase UbiE
MGVYHDHVLPCLVHLVMRRGVFAEYRRRVVGGASGRVLEIGIGSGLNLPFYGPTAAHIVGLDPSRTLLAMAGRRRRGVPIPAHLLEGSAEAVPLDTHSIDSIVVTWALCSVPDVHRALSELRRVLKRGGRLLFVEHGRSPDPEVSRWQDRLTPLWKRVAGGCHLNRPIGTLIEEAGFRLEQISTSCAGGPRTMTCMYEGVARPR